MGKSDIDPGRVEELQNRWNEALAEVCGVIYENESGDAAEALERASQQNFNRQNKQIVMGVAGPGAAGKGTLSKFILNNLGFSKIVNTTTRAKRENEQDGKDYYFTDDSGFEKSRQLGNFALSLERPGRGLYGITNDEVRNRLQTAENGCLFEENPQNILRLFNSELFDGLSESVDKVLLYVLPPNPIIETTMSRLQKRLNEESDPNNRVLTSDVFESTLGDRQIDEFLGLKELINNPSVQPIFLIMKNPEQGGSDIESLLEQ